MHRFVFVVLVVLLAFFAGRLSRQPPADAAGPGMQEEAASACADLNGDGGVDISDAVYLLGCLFLGGPCPECSSPAEGLPATGQSLCYDHVGVLVSATDEAFPGQDGMRQAGCPMQGRFVDPGDGTLSDICTGLLWQKRTVQIPAGPAVSADTRLSWQEALRYCDDLILCRDGTWVTDAAQAQAHGGIKYDDWRLPSVRELESLVDYGKANPAIDPSFDTESDAYWSSTSSTLDPMGAWAVQFFDGRVTDDSTKNIYHYVRGVRGGL